MGGDELRRRKKGRKANSPQGETSDDDRAEGFWSATATSQLSSGDRKERVSHRGRESGDKVTTPNENDEVMGVPSVPQPPQQPMSAPKNKWNDFFLRFIAGMTLMALFGSIVYLGHVAVLGLVILLQSALYKEISHLRKDSEKEKRLRHTSFTRWYFFVVMMLYGHGRALTPQITKILWRDYGFRTLPATHEFVCFVLYSLGIVAFVLTLRKGHFRYQFGMFAWTHMTLLLVILQTTWMTANVFTGLLWFVLPAFLVIANDTSAYICGRAFGRTPLIALSPKKTMEGFIGATVLTVIIGVACVDLLSRYEHMICPKQSLDFQPVSCQPSPIFNFTTQEIKNEYLNVIGIHQITFRPVYNHAVVFALFASIIGPFGGFFASGIKRALNKKDFGDIIPGHGGVTDRFDCQILMAAFVYFYLRSVVFPYQPLLSPEDILYMAARMSVSDQQLLLKMLRDNLESLAPSA